MQYIVCENRYIQMRKTYMEYISILIGILSLIVTFLIFLWDKSKKDEKVIYKRIKLFIVLLILFIGVITIFYLLNRKKSIDKEVSQMCIEVETLMDNESYLEAISTIDKLLYICKDDDKVYILTYYKALCYLCYAEENSDKAFIENTIKVLDDIKDVKNKSSEYYKNTIRILLGYSYLLLDEPMYKSRLDDLVWKMENDTSSSENIDFMYYFLGSYYYDEFEDTKEQVYLDKAMYYYGKGIDIGINFKNIDTTENFLYCSMLDSAGYCYFEYGMGIMNSNVDDGMEYVKQAIEIYETLFEAQDPNKDIYKYYYYKKRLARCYLIAGISNQDVELLHISFEYIENIISADEEILDDHLIGLVPYYVYFSGYNQDIAEILIKRYNRLLEKYTSTTDLYKAVEVRRDLVVIYFKFGKVSGNQEYIEQGEIILKDLIDTYYSLVNESYREIIDGLNNIKY